MLLTSKKLYYGPQQHFSVAVDNLNVVFFQGSQKWAEDEARKYCLFSSREYRFKNRRKFISICHKYFSMHMASRMFQINNAELV